VNGSEVTTFSTTGDPASSNSIINSTSAHYLGTDLGFNNQYLSAYLADLYFVNAQALTPSSFTETDATTGQLIPKAYTGSYGSQGWHLEFADNSSNTATTLGKDTSGNGNNWTPNNLAVQYSRGLPTGYTATGYSGTLTNIEVDNSLFITALINHINFDLGAAYTVGTVTFKFTNADNTNSAQYRIELYSDSGFTTLLANSATATSTSTTNFQTITHNFSSTSARYLRLSYQGGGRVCNAYYLSTTGATSIQYAFSDSLVDVPTNGAQTDTGVGGEVRGNYATLNPLSKQANCTLSNGNLDWTATSTVSVIAQSTIAISSGKWYCEFTATSVSNMFGLQRAAGTVATTFIGGNADSWGYYADNGNKYTNNSATSYGASYTTNDVIGVAFDADAGTLTFYKNGASQGQAYSGLTNGPYTFATGNGGSKSAVFNAGARSFAYTAPSGFKALCTANLPAPLVTKPNTVMDVALYTGNGGNQSITLPGGFNPDLVWVKSRSNSQDHYLFDAIRGGAGILRSNTTGAETTGTTYLSFDTSGFSSLNGLSSNGYTYAGWCWDAGSSTDPNNTAGSITSSVRANATAGFSVVTFTCPASGVYSFGHGLGVVPSMVIMKDRGTGGTVWCVYHSSVISNNNTALTLNSTGAIQTFAGIWGNGITSSVVGSTANVGIVPNSNAVAYCFAPVVGYSNGFSYTGNGSTDGSFVYLGFRPRLILLKCSSTTGNWTLVDTAREGYNVDNDPLYPNLSDAEGTTDLLDITSNGFKLRTTDASVNSNAATYIGFAWAESPFNYSRAR